MLILNRRVGDEIVIDTSDGPVTITVTEVTRANVKLGVDAPPTVRVTRVELLRNYPSDEADR
jgi:carbon storage regulator CsrA